MWYEANISCLVYNIEFESGEIAPQIQYKTLKKGDTLLYRRFNRDNKIYYTRERVKRIVSTNTI